MSATRQDLRAALDDFAEGATAPDGAEVLDGVRRGVVVARRRRTGAIALLAAATTVAGVVAVANQPDRDTTLPAQRPDQVATVVDDPSFPAFALGLRRVVVGPASKASRKLLWRPADAGAVVTVGWTAPASPSRKARFALYQEATWEEYRLPPRPKGLSPTPEFTWGAFAGHGSVHGPAPQASPNDPVTITVPYEEGMGMAFQVRGPGSLRLTVNGQGVALGCGIPSEIISCVPNQDIGETFSTWGYGLADAGTWFDSLPGLVVGQPVTITVHPSHFVGDDWRLGLEYLNR